jgi:DNA-binding CsgD family transcriptional regulator
MKTRKAVLTKEEREILILGALHPSGEHLSNSEIGQRLGISVTRVKTLIHQACVKLEAHNRNEAIFLAMRRGEISLAELLSLDELAEILGSVGPSILREIAHLVRQEMEPGSFAVKHEQIIPVDRRQGGLLTNRERDVLILASSGLTNLEIADRLCMSPSAVRTFLNRASTKLGARRRADAVVLALKQGEIGVGEISSFDEFLEFLAPLGADAIEKMAQLLDEKRRKGPPSAGS